MMEIVGESANATVEARDRAAVLIADDHDVVRQGLLALLSNAFPEIDFGIAGTVDQLSAEMEQHSWDLVILDLGLHNGDGLDALVEIKAKTKSKVLVFSTLNGRDTGVRAIQFGADGYLNRDASVEELVRAVRRILDGHRYVNQDLAERIAEVISKPKVSGLLALSNRELHVLRRIGQGRTTGEIAQEMTLSVKTISTYRSRVLDKLHLHSTAELVRFVVQSGVCG